MCAVGFYFGTKVASNNEAEMQAMLEGIDLLFAHLPRDRGKTHVLFRGDSDLVIKFLNRVYKP